MSSTTPVNRGSLAVRLTVWFSLSAFLLILATTAYLYWALARNLDREDDGTILDQIQILRVLLRDHPADSAAIRQEVEVESGARQHTRLYIRILEPQGRLVAETPGMAERLPPSVFPEPDGKEGIDVRANAESFRVMSARAALGTQEGARRIQVAFDRREQDKLLADFRSGIVPLLAISLVLCG